MPSTAVDVSTLILRLGRDLRTALDQRFTATGLTSQQAGLLIHVYAGRSSPKELAGLLGTDSAGMTRILDRLADKGLITRSPDPTDRRAVTVKLSEAGRALVPSLPVVFEEVSAELTRDLDASEIATVLGLMLRNLSRGLARD